MPWPEPMTGLCTLPHMPHQTRNEHIYVNTLRPRQNGRHFADDTFKRIFLNENVRISIKIPLKFVPKSPIDNIPALFQIMAWCRPGDKPLSKAMMESLLMHICVARPQWVKTTFVHMSWTKKIRLLSVFIVQIGYPLYHLVIIALKV